MSSDDAYAAFLERANQDTGAASTQSQSKSKKASTKAVTESVPASLQAVDAVFVSESDEPFEPVSLRWDAQDLPDEQDFGRLVGRDASRVDAETVDPRGQYKSVVDAVKKAGSGDVGFYEVALDATRTEYFVVSVDAKGKRLVGLKALAVQS